MGKERTPDHLSHSPPVDPYKIAFAIGDLLLDHFQAQGEIRRASEITNELEQDDHFEQLSQLYRQACELMGLAWPPPARAPEAEADRNL
jgi:hypothetical protein